MLNLLAVILPQGAGGQRPGVEPDFSGRPHHFAAPHTTMPESDPAGVRSGGLVGHIHLPRPAGPLVNRLSALGFDCVSMSAQDDH